MAQQSQSSRQQTYAISGSNNATSDDIHDQLKFLPKPLLIILGSTNCLIFLCIVLIVPIIEVAIGGAYRDQCTINPNIPVYLIVTGACGIATIVLTLVIVGLVICMVRRGSAAGLIASGCAIGMILLIISVMSLFLFIWFIVGNVWVFGAKAKVVHDDSSSPNYCHRTVYECAFVLIILTYVFTAISCVSRCIQACVKIGKAN